MPVPETHEEGETASYECAFHILPTGTDEEVSAVFAKLKELVEQAGGTVVHEETPRLLDLAYEIEKSIDGSKRSFNAAYFGWVRFVALPEAAVAADEAVRTAPEVLRHLLVKLTRQEEEQPFFVFATRTEVEIEVDEDGEEGAKEAEKAKKTEG